MVGLACAPLHGSDPQTLMKNAGHALHKAKANGKHQVQVFTEVLNAEASYKLFVENNLRRALTQNELEVFYQPNLCLRSGRLLGLEALLRWNHPERGLLLPDEFIPVAEGQRLMLQIGQWALARAAACAAAWHAEGLPVTPIAVNLSTVQFQSAGFVESVVELLGGEAPGAAPLAGLLELELTERMLMDDLGEVKHRLARLKAAGLTITVDDFGTGYSSLGHLKELPIDKIKIDRSFIQDLPGNRDSAAITCAIVQMGASLGLKVVA